MKKEDLLKSGHRIKTFMSLWNSRIWAKKGLKAVLFSSAEVEMTGNSFQQQIRFSYFEHMPEATKI